MHINVYKKPKPKALVKTLFFSEEIRQSHTHIYTHICIYINTQ